MNLWMLFVEHSEGMWENPNILFSFMTLQWVPNLFDILPMYMVILAMMPVMIVLARVHFAAVAVLSVALWVMGQRAWTEALGLPYLNFTAEPWVGKDDWQRRWFLNPFGWQLIFFTGFAFMRGWLPAPPVKTWLIVLAAVIVVANIPLSNIGVRAVSREWFGPFEGNPVIDWRVANKPLIDKSAFGVFRYIHFLALAYLAWVAAGVGGHRLIAKGGSALSDAWGKLVRIVMKIGQQSLAVFVFSMVFARIAGFVMDQIGRETATVVAVNLIGVVALITVAYFVAWIKGTPWKPKKVVAA